MDLSSLKKIKEDYEEKVKAHGKKALHDALKAFFVANPTVKAIRWTQYTPHFNDGEPCEFSVHDVYAQIEGKEGDSDYGDDFFSSWDLRNDPVRADLDALNRDFGDMEDVLQTVFGDGVRVTATSEGVEVEDYDHD